MAKRLYRSTHDRMVCGVCGGIGEYFEVDPTFIRLLWVILLILTKGFGGLLGYFLACIIIPER
ncbi:MAG TPA: PspC domain-containing protein [Tissierellales bacterium]|nr:PspC domain-containing protein [Tissierellales bacterium]